MDSMKRPTFDSMEQRLAGTEAANYFRGYSTYRPRRESTNFREEHARLVNALRAARKMDMRERSSQTRQRPIDGRGRFVASQPVRTAGFGANPKSKICTGSAVRGRRR
jgi:hypothetical protein